MNTNSLLSKIETSFGELKSSSAFKYYFSGNLSENREVIEKMALLETYRSLNLQFESIRITLFPLGSEHYFPTSYKSDNILLLSDENGANLSLIEVRTVPTKTATVLSRDLSMLKFLLDRAFIQLGVIILIGLTSEKMREKVEMLVKKWQPKEENKLVVYSFNERFEVKKTS